MARSLPATTKGQTMSSKYETFAALHVPGDPVVLYNIWDAGSALAVVAAGAKALATGSHPVADANGWPDGEQVPIDFVFANAKSIGTPCPSDQPLASATGWLPVASALAPARMTAWALPTSQML